VLSRRLGDARARRAAHVRRDLRQRRELPKGSVPRGLYNNAVSGNNTGGAQTSGVVTDDSLM
jgi:hypothetical protein